jgi:hypothetical protein
VFSSIPSESLPTETDAGAQAWWTVNFRIARYAPAIASTVSERADFSVLS